MPPIRPRRKDFGVTMGEYALIGGLVLLVCVVGFMGVGRHWQAWMLGLKGDLAEHAQQTQKIQMEVAQAHQESQDRLTQNQDGGPVDLGLLHTSAANPDVLCGKDFCVNTPGLTGKAILATGSNGSMITHNVANIYTQLAQIMVAKGADAETVSLLTQLASTAHFIGDRQEMLSRYEYLMTVSAKKDLNAKTMGVEATSMRSQLARFQELSQTLDASIGQYPQDVRLLLTGAAQTVTRIGSMYHFGRSHNSKGQAIRTFVPYPKRIQLIHTNANIICDNGGDQSKCHKPMVSKN